MSKDIEGQGYRPPDTSREPTNYQDVPIIELPSDETFLQFTTPENLQSAKKILASKLNNKIRKRLIELLTTQEQDAIREHYLATTTDSDVEEWAETQSFDFPNGIEEAQKSESQSAPKTNDRFAYTQRVTLRAALRRAINEVKKEGQGFLTLNKQALSEHFYIDPATDRAEQLIEEIKRALHTELDLEVRNAAELANAKGIEKQDDKTEAYNAKGIKTFATQELHKLREYGTDSDCVAVVYFDINEFREVNAIIGHQDADALLVEIVRALKQELTEGDGIARTGGDEFSLVLPTKKVNVQDIMERVRTAIAAIDTPEKQKLQEGGIELGVAGGIKIITKKDSNATYEGALTVAEHAALLQKLEGHGFQEFSPEIFARIREKILEDGDERDSFCKAIAERNFTRKVRSAQRRLKNNNPRLAALAEDELKELDNQIKSEKRIIDKKLRAAEYGDTQVEEIFQLIFSEDTKKTISD